MWPCGDGALCRACADSLYLYIGIIVKIKGKSVVCILTLFIKFFHVFSKKKKKKGFSCKLQA